MDYISLISFSLNWVFQKGLKVLLILLVAFLINYIIQSFIVRTVRGKIKGKDNRKKRIDTVVGIFGGTSRFVISIFVILMILPEFGVNIAALLAGVGILGLAIGMASREIVADFLSGIFIIIEDQYNIGDRVRISGIEGTVEDITLRRTLIKDDSNLFHAIPNGQIKVVARKRG